MSDTSLSVFNKAFSVALDIEFDPNWASGTGFFNPAVNGEYAPKLEEGVMYKCLDHYNRRIILIGTDSGNVVVFKRSIDPESTLISVNVPMGIMLLVPMVSSGLDEQGINAIIPSDLIALLGDGKYVQNIGVRLNWFKTYNSNKTKTKQIPEESNTLTVISQEPKITWPKERDVGRYGDMSPHAYIRAGLDSDNDAYVNIWDEKGGASIEFCQPGSGGGKSSRTRMAIIALMVAIEADNIDTPALDWWARRKGTVKI